MCDIKSWLTDVIECGVVFLFALKLEDERDEFLRNTIFVDVNLKRANNLSKQYLSVLAWEVIHACVHDGFKLVNVKYLRQVGKQQKGSSKNELRRN